MSNVINSEGNKHYPTNKESWKDPLGLEKLAVSQYDQKQRRSRVMQLLVAGWSYEMIAHVLSVPEARVGNIIKTELRRLSRQALRSTDEFRRVEVARCEEMLRALWPTVMNGSPRAVEVAIKVSERIARLRGLDKEVEIHHKIDVTVAAMTPPELVAEAERLGLPMPQLEHHIPDTLPGETSTVLDMQPGIDYDLLPGEVVKVIAASNEMIEGDKEQEEKE